MAAGVIPRRLLFVGDSLTYVNDLDQMVRMLAEAAFPELSFVVDRSVIGGAPLRTLWRRGDAERRILSREFDVVILQEDLPETTVQDFHAHTEKFVGACREAGSKPVLLMTWPYSRLKWIDAQGIAKAHYEIAERLGGVAVAPAGVAWQQAKAGRPGLPLLAKDKEHPSLSGSYLTAAVVFATLFGRSPEGVVCDAGGQPVRAQGDQVPYLQTVAWEAAVAERQRARGAAEPGANGAGLSHGELASTVFKALNATAGSRLQAAELRRFQEFLGGRGDAAALAADFELLCAEAGDDPTEGLSEDGFRQLVDVGSSSTLYETECSSEDLQELLVRLRR